MEEIVLLMYNASLYKICFKLIHFIEFIFTATADLSDLNVLIVDVQRQTESFFFFFYN